MIKHYSLFLIPALLLAGCASVPTPPPAAQPSVQLPIPEVVPPIPQPPSEGIIVAPPAPEPKPVMSENHAVIALLDLAQRDNESGRSEAAGASLERALRIEPRNPWLWHELGQLRLTQGHYAQAISFAQKSTTFAGRERRLQALNWRLIGNARVAQGDSAKAEQAFKQATDIEQAEANKDKLPFTN